MKYEEFEKLTELWSYNDMVAYIMEDIRWHEFIFDIIRDNWDNPNDITLDKLNTFGKARGYPEQTQLNLED